MKTTYYLMMDISNPCRDAYAQEGLVTTDGTQLSPGQYRDIYLRVGTPWGWRSRLGWSDADIAAHLARKDREIRVLQDGPNAVGFFEIEIVSPDCGDIRYFGLVPEAIGRGWGMQFLKGAIQCGVERSLRRLLIKTSSSDHPNALRIYRKAGFDLVDTFYSYPKGA